MIFLGYLPDGKAETFRLAYVPTSCDRELGLPYLACVGPFRTMRGANFMRRYGRSNPHCLTISDAERLAKGA